MRTKRQNKPKRHAATKKGGKGKQYSKVKQYSKAKKFSKKAKSVNMRQRRRAVTRRKMRGGVDDDGDDNADLYTIYSKITEKLAELNKKIKQDQLFVDRAWKNVSNTQSESGGEFNNYEVDKTEADLSESTKKLQEFMNTNEYKEYVENKPRVERHMKKGKFGRWWANRSLDPAQKINYNPPPKTKS
jgi:hypothetical protein